MIFKTVQIQKCVGYILPENIFVIKNGKKVKLSKGTKINQQIKNILNFDNIDNKKYREEITNKLKNQNQNSSKKTFANSLQSPTDQIIQNISGNIIKIN